MAHSAPAAVWSLSDPGIPVCMWQSHISIRLCGPVWPGVGNGWLIDWWQYQSSPQAQSSLASRGCSQNTLLLCECVEHVCLCQCNNVLLYQLQPGSTLCSSLVVILIRKGCALASSMISGIWWKSKTDRLRDSEWRKQMQLCRHSNKHARTHNCCDSKHSLNPCGITNPLIVGQLDHVSCRSCTDPAALQHCFILHILNN